MAGLHAKLSPSDAARWMRCPGAIRATEGLPDASSVFAAEGTAMHEVRAACLEFGLDVADFVGSRLSADGHVFEVSPEWVTWIQPGIDRLREMRGALFVEQRVALTEISPNIFGTLDAAVIGDDLIVINDYKGGAGEPVDAEENPQLMLYALGAWWTLARGRTSARRFRLEIDQPRMGGVSTWETDLDHLMAFADDVRGAVKRLNDPNAPRIAGPKQCRWCRAKTTCAEHADFVLDLFCKKLDDLDADILVGSEPAFPKGVTIERRSYILRHADMFSKWLNELHAAALADALAGRPVPGLKAVEGRRGAREWDDEEAVKAKLVTFLPREQAFETRLISPTTAEKRLTTSQWDQVKRAIRRAEAKPILVPEEDKREAIKPLITRFDDLSVSDLI